MPFFWRKKNQFKPSARNYHSVEQLSTYPPHQNNDSIHSGSSIPDFHRSSDLRGGDPRTDRQPDRQQRSLHRPSQSQSHSQAQASQEPIPEPASIRRTQTAHLFQDPEPKTGASCKSTRQRRNPRPPRPPLPRPPRTTSLVFWAVPCPSRTARGPRQQPPPKQRDDQRLKTMCH
ncbi:uncharacterized protein EURHEDRAFT_319681 [Aspergillus ruber CBS 135680]|uniref:Uncharacterized protein n=1 Tax=Aspergillus ruber (strain CBS 135680) TaxID=1388766 RepID=A0A017SJK0_ASPRC|nr:uncharacterized protein EURHEDRAFT_319681 [Aspergillus ruber CBS 135680]EYE97118.1 hypothetical protein EURHEDRAFT_319681 [Aspergillus ruber CBS 135680]